MADHAEDLLRKASVRLTEEQVDAARRAASTGFVGGGRWLATAMGRAPLSASRATYLGIVKYASASLGALVIVGVTATIVGPFAVLPAVLVFYAVEAQMVFLFPVAIDGSPRPFRDAFRLTRRAGGTVSVMRVVLPIAAAMLFGARRYGGFVRAWSVGCLAVVLYYRQIDEAAR